MRNKKLKSSILVLFCLVISGLNAQQTLPVSGGNSTGSEGSISYTLGQVFYSANTGASGSELPGVQQPYEISIISGIEDPIGFNFSCSVYPNPTNNHLFLNVVDFYLDGLTYRLYNLNGELLENEKVLSGVSIINLDNLVPSIYFLKLMQGEKEIKTFKIIKN